MNDVFIIKSSAETNNSCKFLISLRS